MRSFAPPRSSRTQRTLGPATVLASVLLLVSTPSTQALDLRWSGYGTLGYSCFSEEQAQYVINAQTRGPGRENRCDAGLDSILALQLNAQLHPGVELIVQGQLSRDTDQRWRPDVRNAQLSWRASESLQLRAGRSSNPNFLYSETRDLRYALPWARPPLEVYGISPNLEYDGIDALWRHDGTRWSLELQAGISRSGLEGSIDGGTVDPVVFHQGFLALTADIGPVRLKASHARGDVTFRPTGLIGLFDLIDDLGPDGAALVSQLDVDAADYRITALGLRWYGERWNLHSEWAYRPRIGFFRAQRGGYLSIGRHWGRWGVQLSHAARRTEGPQQDARAGPFAPVLAGVLASTRFDNDSDSLTLIRELDSRSRLKLQLDRVQPRPNSFGPYVGHSDQYPLQQPRAENLISLNLDFVF